MTLTKERYRSRFAGKNATHPRKGDLVLIVEGEFAGNTFPVVDVTGNAFGPVYKIHVRGLKEELIWYWSWNVKIVEKSER